MKARVPHGRNEYGFAIGSPQAEQFQRMLDGAKKGASEMKRPYKPRQPSERAAKKRERMRRKLERPEWWDDDMDPTQAKNRRYVARQTAKRAAAKLGVKVPDWVGLYASWGGARQRLSLLERDPSRASESDVITSHLRWRLHSIEEEAEG